MDISLMVLFIWLVIMGAGSCIIGVLVGYYLRKLEEKEKKKSVAAS